MMYANDLYKAFKWKKTTVTSRGFFPVVTRQN